MIRQTRIERHRLIKLAVESMDAASPEKELADFYMEGESEDYIREERGWTRKRIWQTKRRMKQNKETEDEQQKIENQTEIH